MVGRNEDELTRAGVPYETGVARYGEIARGQLIGDTVGMLKLLFHSETRDLLGVHVTARAPLNSCTSAKR
jgi:NAD(P) transhydrogenase